MNTIEMLSSEPWVQLLGWTLVHFLWQGLALAVLYAVARRVIARTSSANARYLLSCAALTAMMAAPLVTWRVMQPSQRIEPPDRTATIPAAKSPAAATLPATVRSSVPTVPDGPLLPWVVMIWLTGSTAFWVRLVGGWVVAARMRSMLVRRAAPEWQATLAQLGARIGVTRAVRLLVSALVQTPTVVGWLRPVVLAPVGALGGLPAEHMEALLLHELAHIRRHDYLVNILQSIGEALLFYHPAVWWVSGHIRAEREACCDDIAVAVSGDALTYACALAQLEAYRPAHLTAAVAANGGSLPDRIARLLEQSKPAARAGVGPGVVTVAALLLVAAYGLFGQSDVRPAFQAASVKPSSSSAPFHMVRAQPGGRLSTQNAPLLMLIQNAYAVQAYQVVGGPGWLNTDGFDIEAKPETSVDRKQTWPMLQTLLADRFKLTVHRETRELPVYALTAKNNLKLPAPKEASCPPVDPAAPPRPMAQTPCGMLRVGPSPVGVAMAGTNIPMAEFIRVLAGVMGRPVLDRTGFSGEFDVNVAFTPDDSTLGLMGPASPGTPPPTNPDQPNIFGALDQQFGLKLVATKGQVEVLVIDHVEKPTAN